MAFNVALSHKNRCEKNVFYVDNSIGRGYTHWMDRSEWMDGWMEWVKMLITLSILYTHNASVAQVAIEYLQALDTLFRIVERTSLDWQKMCGKIIDPHQT